jgi:UDP-2,3-diacylglucosamine pyrophosphatase LpxH
MRITFTSDTHSKHTKLNQELPGGLLLIHAGDFMSTGYYEHEALNFFEWFNKIDNYDYKIFISGNHDRLMETELDSMKNLLMNFKTIDYLQDEELTMYFDGHNGDRLEENVRIYGFPWQPEFNKWAFNLPRNGIELQEKCSSIPLNIDILISHSPAFGHLDRIVGQTEHLGCELLATRINEIKPKIHVCGHIHSGYGYKFHNNIHYINAAALNEQYQYTNKPLTIDWDKSTNNLQFVM